MKNKPCDNATIQKLYRHLLSKGFDYDEVKSAVSKYKESQDIDELTGMQKRETIKLARKVQMMRNEKQFRRSIRGIDYSHHATVIESVADNILYTRARLAHKKR